MKVKKILLSKTYKLLSKPYTENVSILIFSSLPPSTDTKSVAATLSFFLLKKVWRSTFLKKKLSTTSVFFGLWHEMVVATIQKRHNPPRVIDGLRPSITLAGWWRKKDGDFRHTFLPPSNFSFVKNRPLCKYEGEKNIVK